MKTSLYFLSILCFFAFACSSSEQSETDSLPLKVAAAYGIKDFDQVSTLRYTWNVRVDSARVISRKWIWHPASGEVNYTDQDTTVTYFLQKKDSTLKEIDSRFINDKYWLLFPFQLAWDTGYDYEVNENQSAPISGDTTTKLTIVYNHEDGYTPGDAYDLYLDDKHQIKEWVFRRGNGPSGRAMTWENVEDYQGLKIALDHRDDQGNLVLWFSDVEVR
jgi:hypothetical protein